MRKILEQFKQWDFVNPETTLGAIVFAIIFALLAWLVGRALRLAVQRMLARNTSAYVDRTTINFLAQLAQFGVYLFAFISYAHLVPGLRQLGTAWLASVGVVSVVVGMAAQNTLGNLIAGFALVLYRPFKAGDRLQVTAPTGLETGVVESINLGYTILKTDDNRRIVVPNSTIASQTTVNLTGEDPRVVCSVPVSIGCDADIDKARAILLELARQNSKAQQVIGCPLTQWGPNGIVLTLSAWCPSSGAAADLKNDLLEQVRKRFNREGIEVPFPRMHVEMDKGTNSEAVERSRP